MDAKISGSVERWTRRPSWWRVYQEDDLKAMNLRRRMGIFQSSFQHVRARDNSGGDQLLGFGSREAMDHIFMVGFVR